MCLDLNNHGKDHLLVGSGLAVRVKEGGLVDKYGV